MHTDPTSVLLALGLPPDLQLRPIAESAAPASAGMALAAGAISLVEVVRNLVLTTAVAWSTPVPASEPAYLPEVRRHVDLPGVAVIDVEGAEIVRSAGRVELFDGDLEPRAIVPEGALDSATILVLDGREEMASVLVRRRDRVFVLSNQAGKLSYDELPTGRFAIDPSSFVPASVLADDLAVPSAQTLIDGWQSVEWLRQCAEADARSVVPLVRVASVGLVARLWQPTSRVEAQAILSGSKRSPSERASDWVRTLPEDQLDALEVEALELAEQLAGMLDRFEESSEEAEALWPDFLRRRDDAASLSYLLSSAKRGRTIAMRLQAVDRAARAHLSTLCLDEDFASDPRWAAVVLADPLAWWADVACAGALDPSGEVENG
jgi:hypothetical protein